jgi:hypothetical protein
MALVKLDTGVIRFLDPRTGKPVAGGKVYTKDQSNGLNAKTWKDQAGTLENKNPVVLDLYGEAPFFGDIVYFFEVYTNCGKFIGKYDNVGTFVDTPAISLPVLGVEGQEGGG